MAVLPIRRFPDPVLKTPSRPVTRISAGLLRLIDDMIETMRYYPRCVGLAAPQVGQSVQVAVVDVSTHPKATRPSGLLLLINPRILIQEGTLVQREGCLSVPDLTGNVCRAPRVQVNALDTSGVSWVRWFEGFEAVAVQHELDHLAGRLFLDRIANVRTDLFRRKHYWFPEGGTSEMAR